MFERRDFLMAAGAAVLASGARSRPRAEEAALPDNKNGIALALGGGAAKGFAHIPYLECLDEMGVRPAQLAGTSMGAIMAALYAAGMSGKEIRESTLELFSEKEPLLRKLLLNNTNTWASLFNLMRPAVIDPEVLFKAVLPPVLPDDFAGLSIPLSVVATDFYRQSQAVLDHGALLPAISASAALPVLLTPVVIGDKVLIDGGFVNPTPFDVLDNGRYFTVGIDVTGSLPRDGTDLPGSLETWAGSFSITQRSIVLEKLKCGGPDLYVAPPVGQFATMDFFDVEAILSAADTGRDAFKHKIAALLER
ncbi:patatin-like phospholipase family protein [Martelella sp. HB161492]|uniref:patatin-like phospholipase family protein n=1 Tax=Martelella sp. HB161492 TaxID=2720726 RepID=UPI001591889B|nr:patatin-like phospholipase family protein [Martelella sp. HB161492]